VYCVWPRDLTRNSRLMLRLCRRLIDPSASPMRAQPHEPRDILIAARESWLMAYDNINTLLIWLSKGLCKLATGTGFSIRAIATDDHEAISVAQQNGSTLLAPHFKSRTLPSWFVKVLRRR
jgi:hypothetical protein